MSALSRRGLFGILASVAAAPLAAAIPAASAESTVVGIDFGRNGTTAVVIRNCTVGRTPPTPSQWLAAIEARQREF